MSLLSLHFIQITFFSFCNKLKHTDWKENLKIKDTGLVKGTGLELLEFWLKDLLTEEQFYYCKWWIDAPVCPMKYNTNVTWRRRRCELIVLWWFMDKLTRSASKTELWSAAVDFLIDAGGDLAVSGHTQSSHWPGEGAISLRWGFGHWRTRHCGLEGQGLGDQSQDAGNQDACGSKRVCFFLPDPSIKEVAAAASASWCWWCQKH